MIKICSRARAAHGGLQPRCGLPHALIAGLLAALLTACGGGGSGDADDTAPVVTQTPGLGDTIPRFNGDGPQPGDVRQSTLQDGRLLTDRYIGAATLNGEAGHEFQEVLSSSGGTALETLRYAVVERGDVSVWHPLAGYSPLTLAFGPRQSLLNLPLRTGHRAELTQGPVAVAQDFDGDGVFDKASRRVEQVVLAVEARATPAGLFSSCVRYSSVETRTLQFSSGQPAVTLVERRETWAAPGVGTVYATILLETLRPGQSPERSFQTLTLTGYRLGSRSGGSVG